jgi:hypothetical protein
MKCENCSQEFTPNTKNYTKHVQRFCSTRCRNTFHRENDDLVSFGTLYPMLNTTSVAVVNRWRVAAHLLSLGYSVFQNIATASCDLVVYNDIRNHLRIKVTSASVRENKVYSPRYHNTDEYDILAICTPDKIIYDPELPGSYITSSSVDDVPETSA